MSLMDYWRLTKGERKMAQLAEQINKASNSNWVAQISFEHPDREAAVEAFYLPTWTFYTVGSFEQWERVRDSVQPHKKGESK